MKTISDTIKREKSKIGAFIKEMRYVCKPKCSTCSHKMYCAKRESVSHCFFQSKPDNSLHRYYESETWAVRKQRNRRQSPDYE